MKCFLILLILLICVGIVGETIYIDNDGGQDYSTIQEGVEAAVNGDTIIVYPGIYYAPISFNEKSLTIGSLEMTTGNEHYINQTIIDGNNQYRCIDIYNVNTGCLRGFLIRNGFKPDFNTGGIGVGNSTNIELVNCIVAENKEGNSVGIHDSDQIFLSGLSIHDNMSCGLFLYRSSNITFDENNLCSIYNNKAAHASDLYSYWAQSDLSVTLDTITVENPSTFFVHSFDSDYDFEFEYENTVMEEIDQDLYVAPDGNDNNSGLSPDEPLQTIYNAVYRIKSNPLDPNTIHIASGDYSKSLNNQIFTIGTKSHITFSGGDDTNIICDDEYNKGIYFHTFENVTVENINFSKSHNRNFGYSFYYGKNLNLNNLTFSSSEEYYTDSHINFDEIQNCCLDSITIRGINAEWRPIAQIEEITGKITNCNFSNNVAVPYLTPNYCLVVGIRDYELNSHEPALIMENCILQNNEAELSISCFGDLYGSGGERRDEVILNNLIFINNTARDDESNYSFSFAYGIDPVYMNNCLFVNNSNVGEYSVGIAGSVNINNSVFHNDPIQEKEIKIINSSFGNIEYPYDTHVVLNNCAIKGGNESYYLPPGDHTITFNNTYDTNDYEFDEIFNITDSTDYRSYAPCPDSPLIDNGFYDHESYLPEFDIMGNDRVIGEQIDIGPFEYIASDLIDEEENPDSLNLIDKISNYPNPFYAGFDRNDSGTTISFKTANFGRVKVDIFNIKGQKVKQLKNVSMTKGMHEVWWSGFNEENNRVSSGIYFCRIKLNKKTIGMLKMLVLK